VGGGSGEVWQIGNQGASGPDCLFGGGEDQKKEGGDWTKRQGEGNGGGCPSTQGSLDLSKEKVLREKILSGGKERTRTIGYKKEGPHNGLNNLCQSEGRMTLGGREQLQRKKPGRRKPTHRRVVSRENLTCLAHLGYSRERTGDTKAWMAGRGFGTGGGQQPTKSRRRPREGVAKLTKDIGESHVLKREKETGDGRKEDVEKSAGRCLGTVGCEKRIVEGKHLGSPSTPGRLNAGAAWGA